MTATRIMIIGILVGVVGRWANNKPTVPSVKGLLQVVGAVVLVAAMDGGRTEPVARGFAWLFLAAVLLSDSSPITGLAKAEGFSSNGPKIAGSPAGGNPGTINNRR